MSDPWLGKTLGRYRIVRRIGRGGMGAVYEAVQENLGRRVALKVLHGHLTEDADLIARFRREAETAAGLSHPNIVQVTDFGSVEGETVYLVMEYLDGESLAQVLHRETRLAPDRVAFIATQILSALGAAHHAGIVHRDLKPDNIILVSIAGVRDIVKIVDFGIAKLAGSGKLTATGTVVGTPAYMAPEQARGADVGPRADLYSTGALMYEALAGRAPFDAPNYHSLMVQVLEATPPPLSTLRSDIDPALAGVVARAMMKDPHSRYASADEMAHALEPWADPSHEHAPAVGTAPTAPALVTPSARPAATTAPGPAPTGPIPGTRAAEPLPAPAAALPPPAARPRTVPAWTLALAAGVILGAGALWAGNLFGPGDTSDTELAAASPPPATLAAIPEAPIAQMPAPTIPGSAGIGEGRGGDGRPHGAAGLTTAESAIEPQAPSPVTVPAPAPAPDPVIRPALRRATHAPSARYSGGIYPPYPPGVLSNTYNAMRQHLDPCFAPHRYSEVPHMYTDWRISIAADGTVTGVEPHGDQARAIPELTRCVTSALRRHFHMGPPPNGEPVTVQLHLNAELQR